MPALPSCIVQPCGTSSPPWPPHHDTHPLGCHRPASRPHHLRQAHPSPGLRLRLSPRRRHHLLATTLRRRRNEWIALGLGERLHLLVLAAYDRMLGLQLDDLAVDGCITKAPCGGQVAGRSPVDRGKQGLKRSLATDAAGIPLATVPAPANRNDSPLLAPTLDKTLGTLDTLGPRPAQPTVHLDAGYDSDTTRTTLAERDPAGQIARRASLPRSRPPGAGGWSAPSPGATRLASCAGAPNATPQSWSSGWRWPTRSSSWVG